MNNLLEYKGYHANIEMEADDKIFVGTVLGINDSLSFHGHTVEELQKQFEICIDDYIEMCKHFGKEPEKEYKGSFNIRIPSEMHKKLNIRAISQKTTINKLVVNAIARYLNENIESEKIYVVAIPVKQQQLDEDNVLSKYESDDTNIKNYTETRELKEVVAVQ